MKNFFQVKYRSKKSQARLGEINLNGRKIKTPAFVPVATKGTLKALPPGFISEIGIQVAFVNTYHLVTHPGVEVIKKAGGIHKFAKLNIPLMSDSGGFQVFSLASPKRKFDTVFFDRLTPAKWGVTQAIVSKKASSLFPSARIKHLKADVRGEEEPLLVKISDDGVKFRSTYDGKLLEFTPEKSMEYQKMIGADINMAFDECIPYGVTYDYSKKATERTHRWLKRCIEYKNKFEIRNSKSQTNSKSKIQNFKQIKKFKVLNFKNLNFNIVSNFDIRVSNFQYLYGIIQGGVFEDLRKKSAEFVVSQNTAGVAIGGVSVGESKKEMRDQVKWVAPFLPVDRPVHLLGVGQFDDIIDLVKYGIDTFDCVEPTRLARVGKIYQSEWVLPRVSLPPVLTSLRAVGIPSSRATHSLYEIDILKGIYKNDLSPVDEDCNCYVCQNFTKAYLHHLFKQKEILGYTLATYHNLWVMERLFDRIREAIEKDFI